MPPPYSRLRPQECIKSELWSRLVVTAAVVNRHIGSDNLASYLVGMPPPLKKVLTSLAAIWESFERDCIKRQLNAPGLSRSFSERRKTYEKWTKKYQTLFDFIADKLTAPKMKLLGTTLPKDIKIIHLLQAFNGVSVCWFEIMEDFRSAIESAEGKAGTSDNEISLSCRVSVLHTSYDDTRSEQPIVELRSEVFPFSLLRSAGEDETLTPLHQALVTLLTRDHTDGTLEAFSEILRQVSVFQKEEEREGSITPTNSTGGNYVVAPTEGSKGRSR
ncbi:hypothetical protein QFC21_002513 [Naganishia friedmannii]|uniref:Uncharacterized protein n=1 Tax=Naganishia friedmannii TaxID=89922 RepID=A0ACC2VWU7_9TREE|nr:hypothetical protein QFC21_002513 [Naganishia friedmannii]